MKNQNVAKTIQKQNISCKLSLSLLSQLMIKLNSIKIARHVQQDHYCCCY